MFLACHAGVRIRLDLFLQDLVKGRALKVQSCRKTIPLLMPFLWYYFCLAGIGNWTKPHFWKPNSALCYSITTHVFSYWKSVIAILLTYMNKKPNKSIIYAWDDNYKTLRRLRDFLTNLILNLWKIDWMFTNKSYLFISVFGCKMLKLTPSWLCLVVLLKLEGRAADYRSSFVARNDLHDGKKMIPSFSMKILLVQGDQNQNYPLLTPCWYYRNAFERR